MRVVANSSVLIGLCTIGQLGLLQKKWEEIIIPRAVWKEYENKVMQLRLSLGEFCVRLVLAKTPTRKLISLQQDLEQRRQDRLTRPFGNFSQSTCLVCCVF